MSVGKGERRGLDESGEERREEGDGRGGERNFLLELERNWIL